ncbi:hypothetical protein BaRGS_00027653 [Batillaria attramentaria]|uniref:Uncharacterized protein n=1 Tax=Batillaria attramentaria TaxID=370345 RepID=A0ABD0K1R5_9CAEN
MHVLRTAETAHSFAAFVFIKFYLSPLCEKKKKRNALSAKTVSVFTQLLHSLQKAEKVYVKPAVLSDYRSLSRPHRHTENDTPERFCHGQLLSQSSVEASKAHPRDTPVVLVNHRSQVSRYTYNVINSQTFK